MAVGDSSKEKNLNLNDKNLTGDRMMDDWDSSPVGGSDGGEGFPGGGGGGAGGGGGNQEGGGGVGGAYSGKTNSSQWEGEDEEEEVADSWDMEEDAEEEKRKKEEESLKKSQEGAGGGGASKKKSLKKIGERAEERKKASSSSWGKSSSQINYAEERGDEESESPSSSSVTPEERLAEKLRRQKLEEEADLELAKEMFAPNKATEDEAGGTGVGPSSSSLPDSLETKEDFDALRATLIDLLLRSDSVKRSPVFHSFVEELFKDLSVHLPTNELKKLSSWTSNLHIEKTKLEKGEKNKSKGSKSKSKAKLKMEGDNDFFAADYSNVGDEFDDYI